MRPCLLPHLLTDAAASAPERPAVIDAHGAVSYGDLDRRTDRLAHVLAHVGVRPGDRVGLFLNKSADAIAGIYGILKAGAAYVPLDPFAPAARLAYIAGDCGIRCLVTSREKAGTWGDLLRNGAPLAKLIVLDAGEEEVESPGPGVACLGRAALLAAPERAPAVRAISQDLAYILYTSGSTGQPKGVMLSHLNALTFVRWCYDYLRPTPADVFSNHAPLHFDLSILDLYVAALAGAALVLVPPETSVFPMRLAEFIEQTGITIWYSVPSVLSLLVVHGRLAIGRLASLRHVLFAGEVFPIAHLRRLMAVLPHVRFTNLYGPTETNVCTYYPVPPLAEEQTAPIPIGRAIGDVEVWAADEQGRRVPPGEVGELWVRGPTVAYGYWGDAERTARAFVANPSGLPDRVYRTGDLVRQNADGDLLFLGRRDHQIKSRGYRIELGDVEAALYAHPQVVECAVVAVPDEIVGNRLKAFVVTRGAGVTGTDLARFCATLLPRYMVPDTFTFLRALPRTSTGKTDRTALASAPTAV